MKAPPSWPSHFPETHILTPHTRARILRYECPGGHTNIQPVTPLFQKGVEDKPSALVRRTHVLAVGYITSKRLLFKEVLDLCILKILMGLDCIWRNMKEKEMTGSTRKKIKIKLSHSQGASSCQFKLCGLIDANLFIIHQAKRRYSPSTLCNKSLGNA